MTACALRQFPLLSHSIGCLLLVVGLAGKASAALLKGLVVLEQAGF